MKIGWNKDRDIEGFIVPWWLGLAGRNHAERRTRLLPVPFNVLWVWLSRAFIWMRFGIGHTDKYRAAFDKGYDEGMEQKQQIDLNAARMEGRAEVIAKLEALANMGREEVAG